MRKEFILCAAIMYKGMVISGYRHGDCHELLDKLVPGIPESEQPGRESQGFLTSHNRYVDRAEAFKIAKENGQIIHNMFDGQDEGELTSEDLY